MRVDETIQQVERLYQQITGRSLPEGTLVSNQQVATGELRATVERRLEQLMQMLQDPTVTPNMMPWNPPVAIWECDSEIIVRVDLPGVKKEDVDISVRNHLLSISGIRRMFRKEERHEARTLECRAGHFQRSIVLPIETVDTKVNTRMSDGVLEIILPKTVRNSNGGSLQ